jgi:hypothetical protein
MKNYTLIIKDNHNNTKIIQEPQFVPRVGDRIYMGYDPAPEVYDVVVDYDRSIIAVTCA